eukprot:Amastigsp_a531729_42.p2 type:complete len:118 gc:universal Amastigsp_a531729_42:436-83(-)
MAKFVVVGLAALALCGSCRALCLVQKRESVLSALCSGCLRVARWRRRERRTSNATSIAWKLGLALAVARPFFPPGQESLGCKCISPYPTFPCPLSRACSPGRAVSKEGAGRWFRSFA